MQGERTILKDLDSIRGLKVTVMGLGLNGGGVESARFFHDAGATVTVTDLRGEDVLRPSIEALGGRGIRYVLGRHETDDFSKADIVIKNPAVRRTSVYLEAAKAIETDISIFLRFSRSPLVAVTGSKGKSSTASAIHHGFVHSGIASLLGGNITVSPLSFLSQTAPERPVVLEMSSWQLADLRGMGVLKPKAAVLTAIMPDHMNYYSSMEQYVADKRVIYAGQDGSDFTICDFDSEWGRSFAAETPGRVLWYSEMHKKPDGAWLETLDGMGEAGYCSFGAPADRPDMVLPPHVAVAGRHQRKNLLAASLALRAMGVPAETAAKALATFPGIEHRLEFFAESAGVRWYNDSASTIPQAVDAALSSFECPVVLITGGTDKNIDFSPVRQAYGKAAAIILLEGTGTRKLIPLLEDQGLSWLGPYPSLEEAVRKALEEAKPGMAVVLSPGCTSFGMFLHEFDRGKKFKETVLSLLPKDQAPSATKAIEA